MLSSTIKTLNILNVFTDKKNTYTFSELVDLTQYNKTTLYRMLGDLVASGFLEKDIHTKTYHIGPSIIRLANIAGNNDIQDKINWHLQKLCNTVHQTVHSTILSNNTLIIKNVVYAQRPLRIVVDIDTIPIDKTGSGFTYLAHTSTQTRNKLCPHWQTDDIYQNIMFCEHHGYSISIGKLDADAISLTAPIFGRNGQIISTISIVYPILTNTDTLQQQYAYNILKCAQDIMHDIGGMTPKTYAPTLLSKTQETQDAC